MCMTVSNVPPTIVSDYELTTKDAVQSYIYKVPMSLITHGSENWIRDRSLDYEIGFG